MERLLLLKVLGLSLPGLFRNKHIISHGVIIQENPKPVKSKKKEPAPAKKTTAITSDPVITEVRRETRISDEC